ncbi:fibroblast growth factor 5 isoform X2 [Lates calcarifer]|uniref:Fibroblast growth factor n=1 Tax=Lates calcarifer TaxID=8187 RepID=A0AAJ7PT13_LATCA|nr:fibroblast growth factor 5 isoform X2 [Lates calcarifer]
MNFVVERAGFRPEVTHTELTVLCLVNIQQVVPAKTTDQVLSPDTCATKQVQHTQNIFLLSGLTKLNCSPAGYCQLGVLELFAVSQGVIGIKGVYSNRFLAMNKRGRLHATEWFTDDCKFRERFQENSYNTYASVIHRNHRTGREWFVALNKRGKAKMGSSPRVKSQHVSTHFLPRVSLHDKSERGFTITDRSKERRKSPPPAPPKPPVAKANVHAGTAPRRQVKYWPKYRFG